MLRGRIDKPRPAGRAAAAAPRRVSGAHATPRHRSCHHRRCRAECGGVPRRRLDGGRQATGHSASGAGSCARASAHACCRALAAGAPRRGRVCGAQRPAARAAMQASHCTAHERHNLRSSLRAGRVLRTRRARRCTRGAVGWPPPRTQDFI
jgi:hypothetical protein